MNTCIYTCDPDFIDLAQDEMRKAAPKATVSELAEGVFLVESTLSFIEVAEAWRLAPPIFVRHICPADDVVPLSGKVEDIDLLCTHATEQLTEWLDPSLPFSVQTRILHEVAYKPFDVNTRLADVLAKATNAPIDVRAPQQILSIVIANAHQIQNPKSKIQNPVAFLGLSHALHNLSDWAGGMRRFAREEGQQVSRSEFKLLEALEVFAINLPTNGVALDLGASPGGWTRVLRQLGQYVTAIDPGELDVRLRNDKGIRHKRMTAEEYLHNEPDQFDLLVNDMRMDARDSARLMVAYAKQLYKHGSAIMTLKLPEQGRRIAMDHALNILQQAYTIEGAKQLFHNRSEITLYLTPMSVERRT